SFNFGPTGNPGSLQKGTGYSIDLPAYENDVLTALALTGGLPGLDAVNEVVIERGSFRGDPERAGLLQGLQANGPGCLPPGMSGYGTNTTRIPLRLRPGEPPPFRPDDIILQTGDIVFIEARKADLFYTGGLLPPGEHALPRASD